MTQMLLTALLLAALVSVATAQSRDISLKQTTTFTIEQQGDVGYQVESRVDIEQTFHSKRATENYVFPVVEQYFDSITHIGGTFRGDQLARSAISYKEVAGADVFLSNTTLYLIRFPNDIDTGETVSYYYRKQYLSPAFIPVLSIPNTDYVSEYSVVIKHPEEVSVDFEFIFPRGSLPYTIDRKEPGTTQLTFTGLTGREQLPYYPFDDTQGMIQIKINDTKSSLTPTTLKEFTGWYFGLFEPSPVLGSPNDTLLASVLQKATGVKEKIRIIHDYVRKNIRYIADERAINAIVPRSPDLVLDRRYGDCKDRAYLVAALARKNGITINMALVSTEPTPALSGTHVSQFNHVICEFTEGGKTIFFDPTHKYCEFGNLPESDIGAEALVLDPREPRRHRITAPDQKRSLEIVINSALVRPKEGKARITLRNDLHSFAQRARAELSGVNLENALSNLVTSYFQKISLDYFEFESQGEDSMIFTATADLSEFLIASSSKEYIPHVPFRMVDPEILKREGDTLPIYLDGRENISMRIILQTPAYNVDPATITIGDAPARYHASIESGPPGETQLSYAMVRTEKVLQGESKAGYIRFCREYLKSKKNMFVLTRSAQ